MRYTQSEKMEIIRVVEHSHSGVRKTLRELGLAPSTFYVWYGRYEEHGYDGLASRPPTARTFWNRIPAEARVQLRDVALENPALSPRELAYRITDREGWFISESSVYRILRDFDLLPAPAYIVMTADTQLGHPTHAVNELWQTDFTYMHVVGWGWYYLGTVPRDYSRYIVRWKLCPTMASEDVKTLLDAALTITGVDRPMPRLLSDNGPCYVSQELASWLDAHGMTHTHSAPYHGQTQGKIERYHRRMKNRILLEHYYAPTELEHEIARFVAYYNHERVHESIGNVTPADVYFGRQMKILERRERIKRRTLQRRRAEHVALRKRSMNTHVTFDKTVSMI